MTNDRALLTFCGIVAAIAVFAALYLATSVFAPVACALFIIAMVWPLQAWLQARMPQLIALAIVMSVTVIVFVAFASVVAWGFGRIGRSMIAEAPRFQMLYDQATQWLEGHGIVVASMWSEHFNVRWLIRAVQGIGARLNTTISFWLVVLVYVILGIARGRAHRPQDPRAGEGRYRATAARRFGANRGQAAPLHDDPHLDERRHRRHGVGACHRRRTCSSRRNGASSPSRSITFRSSGRSSPPCFRRSMRSPSSNRCRRRWWCSPAST